MDVTCRACGTAYQLDDDRVPRRRLRLRCPVCSAGVVVDGIALRRPPRPPRAGDRRAWARRLARALVSDILVYHRERRDRALAAGDLLEEFGVELAGAWREFKDRTGPDAGDWAPLFREAVDEILAGGRPLLAGGGERDAGG